MQVESAVVLLLYAAHSLTVLLLACFEETAYGSFAV